jgi:hypothetical protein
MLIRANAQPQRHKPASWPNRPEQGGEIAISRWGLKQKGWMGFDALPWVAKVREDYPEAIALAQRCSVHRPEFREQAQGLFQETPTTDRPALRDYFAGKLGLEILSCRRSGAGAGMCDKRSAYMEIYEIANQACKNPQ